MRKREADLDKTLEELEGERWGEADFPSRLVAECHRLRTVPLRRLSVEDLRLLLGQDIGTRHLLPMALERLEADPFVEGDFYPGDLLCNVLSLPRTVWAQYPDLRDRAASAGARAVAAIGASEFEHGVVTARAVRKAFDLFVANGDSAT